MPGFDAPPAFIAVAADPQRWRLLHELAGSDRRVSELVALIGRPQSVVSYHLGELRRAGLVAARRSSADGRDTYYRLDLARCRDALSAAGADLHPGLRLVPAPARPPVLDARRRPRVLFLCTGNSARSQIAEALLVRRSGGACDALSAGSHPKPIHPAAVAAMAARGIDISGCASKHHSRFQRRRFDRVITLCDKVREVCPEFPGATARAHWSIPDPASGAAEHTVHAFDAVADELSERIDFLVSELADHD